jgi:hypothetical protein
LPTVTARAGSFPAPRPGRRAARVAALDAYPNVEIRICKSIANRSARLLDFVTDLDKVNYCTHSEIMVVETASWPPMPGTPSAARNNYWPAA